MDALRELLTQANSQVSLDRAALELARIEHPDLDPLPWQRQLDELALLVADRATNLSDGFQFLTALNTVLFQDLGFHGNETFYYDPRNSCLNDVLAFRTGIPITLSLVCLEIARRLSKPLHGIGAPGHFLCEYNDGRLAVFIDPFRRGRMMNREQCLELVRGYLGPDLAEAALARVTPKQLLVRMLRNMEGAYIRANRFEQALAAGELLRLAGAPASGGIARNPGGNN